MLDTAAFGSQLKALGYDFYSGVPCSFLKNLINHAINEEDFVMAANEGDAVAICAGAHLGGRKTVFLCQNSGLTNAASPLTSLNYPFQLPVLGFVSLRGEEGLGDEPQHQQMGRITTHMLDAMEIPWQYLEQDSQVATQQLQAADEYITGNRPFFFVVRKGTFSAQALGRRDQTQHLGPTLALRDGEDELPSRWDALQIISNHKDQDTALLATTGFTGRELHEVEDAPNNLYMVGSMGCVSSIALGLALTKKDKKVVAIDGDGSLLMRMGSLATNAYYSPSNMLHIVLDNNAHDSTGGQSTTSGNVDFTWVASGSGYPQVIYVHSLAQLERELTRWHDQPCLTLLYLRIQPGKKDNLGRPKIKPHEVKERLMAFLEG